MTKEGILHDYDLMANAEHSSQDQRCRICDACPMRFQWSDYSGEAMCVRCGAPYQLKWGGKEMENESKYPYFVLREELIEPLRAYFKETGKFTTLGTMVGPRPGSEEFADWLKTNRPETYEQLKKK